MKSKQKPTQNDKSFDNSSSSQHFVEDELADFPEEKDSFI